MYYLERAERIGKDGWLWLLGKRWIGYQAGNDASPRTRRGSLVTIQCRTFDQVNVKFSGGTHDQIIA
jgi:hypothetical protein